MSNRVEQMEKIQLEGLELFKKKNKDYGDAFDIRCNAVCWNQCLCHLREGCGTRRIARPAQ